MQIEFLDFEERALLRASLLRSISWLRENYPIQSVSPTRALLEKIQKADSIILESSSTGDQDHG